MSILMFLAVALLLSGLFAAMAGFLFKKMNQSAAAGAEMNQNAEAVLVAFATRVGARRDEPRRDSWGNQHGSNVHYRCHELDVDVSFGVTQGASKNERILLPVLLLHPPAGSDWRESPKGAIQQALAGLGHSARRMEAGVLTTGNAQNAYAVYLDTPEKRHAGNFVAPVVESVIDAETLARMVDVICRAARSVVVGAGRVTAP